MALIDNNQRPPNATDIIQAISQCNRTAWVGYKPLLEKAYEELYKSQTESLYIGKETIYSKDRGIFISRWVDPRVPVRLAWLKVSGIIDLWFRAKYKRESYAINEPVKLSMKGNIVTVFMIMLGGLGIAATFVIFEIFRYTIQSMKTTINTFFIRASRQVVMVFIVLKHKILKMY